MGNGLLTSEDPLHATQRRVMLPAFHRESVARYADIMGDCADRMCSSWKDGETIDMHREMLRLTLEILGKTLFNQKIDEDASDIGAAVTELMSLVDLVFVPFGQHLIRLPLPGMWRLKRVRDRLDRLIYGLLEDRLRSGDYGDDLVSMLLRHQLSEGKGERAMRQVRDECLTIMLAGHETIANALTYAIVLLAQNAEHTDRARAEVDRVTGGSKLRGHHYEQLIFTRAALMEAMRLYPPVWVLGRAIKEPCAIGLYTAPKGSILFASQYLLHRDPRFFPDPDSFQPQRFLTSNRVNQFAYFPFGVGPRRCIGEGFALTEGVLALGTIMRRWNIELAPNFKLILDPKVTLRPKAPVLVRIKAPQARTSNQRREEGSISSCA